jgi:hypothetical protein
MNLADKYRPRTLSELVGQPWAVHQLQTFVESPYSVAFLFEGATGTGKTSAALALARDLGVDIDGGPFGGFHEIASGEQTAESVRRVMDGMRLHTLSGSGWKVLVVNEADCLSTQAGYVWLDALENLPTRTVIVFTTNDAHKLPARLRDRFESGYLAVAPYLPELIARVWKAETGRDDPPDLDSLGAIKDDAGNVSVRRLLQLLTPFVREAMTVGFSKQVRIVHARQVAAATQAAGDPIGDFDAAAIWRRRQNGESWKVLANELKLPETTIRGRLYRAGLMKRGGR